MLYHQHHSLYKSLCFCGRGPAARLEADHPLEGVAGFLQVDPYQSKEEGQRSIFNLVQHDSYAFVWSLLLLRRLLSALLPVLVTWHWSGFPQLLHQCRFWVSKCLRKLKPSVLPVQALQFVNAYDRMLCFVVGFREIEVVVYGSFATLFDSCKDNVHIELAPSFFLDLERWG